jgi:Acetyltransferase (GNAT) domain
VPVSATGGDRTAAAWDEFVDSSPRGQFQQTSGWARLKAREGWSAAREYLDPIAPCSGGFQLLWKQSRFARIGYVSKGPVLPEETQVAVNAALERVATVARRLRLAAVVVQPPDDSWISSDALVRHGFFCQPVQSVIRATGIISLDGGADGVVKRMARTARQDWHSACRQGVKLAWGTRDDLALFFRLMCESARRQHAIPNPARVDLLEALWDAFPNRVNLAFAEQGGRKLAGLVTIGQGGRIVFWKKGWNSEQPRLFASQFLMTECLIWASAVGHAYADLVGMSPEIAAKVLANTGLSEQERRSRDIFNLRLGARPKLLPPAHLLIVNPALRRALYRGLRWRRLRIALYRRVR